MVVLVIVLVAAVAAAVAGGCVGDGDAGAAVRAPVFEAPLSNQCLLAGQTALFKCVVSGHPPAEIVWTRRGHPLLDKTRYSINQSINLFQA